MKNNIQSVLFNKDTYTLKTALNYLKKHNLKYNKVDETQNYYRFRQFDPPKGNYFMKTIKKGLMYVIYLGLK